MTSDHTPRWRGCGKRLRRARRRIVRHRAQHRCHAPGGHRTARSPALRDPEHQDAGGGLRRRGEAVAQKGTGRARQGSIRSPQWRGGGVALRARAPQLCREDAQEDEASRPSLRTVRPRRRQPRDRGRRVVLREAEHQGSPRRARRTGSRGPLTGRHRRGRRRRGRASATSPTCIWSLPTNSTRTTYSSPISSCSPVRPFPSPQSRKGGQGGGRK